ncbi:MAG TPA: cation diffusion facilitator family transporter [candidate division Zixibacteria bacterium]|nr:cation diffusion facilitator family transporter [candidate division Zixibacteria bacterium]
MAHVHSHKNVSGKRLSWTIFFNLLITIAEFIGGIVSGYLALVADAAHNLSDVAALGLAWIGDKGSEMQATKRSTYGFKRLEVMTAFISAVALVVIAVFIFVEAFGRLIHPQPLTHPTIFLVVASIGLIGNVVSILLLHSEKGKSLNMKTAFLHMAYDAISSVAVLIGGVIILLTGLNIIDIILSTIIALMIVWSSYQVIKEAVLVFLEAVPPELEFDQVLKSIDDTPRVKDVHDLHIWSLSSNDIALSCHVCIDQKDYLRGTEIIASINTMLAERYHIGHATIQLETEDCNRTEILCGQDNAELELNWKKNKSK